MTDRSAAADGSSSPGRKTLQHNSNNELDSVRSPTDFSDCSDGLAVTSEARIRTSDIGDNCIETECERLNKYPDYCRTITIRGLVFFIVFVRQGF